MADNLTEAHFSRNFREGSTRPLFRDTVGVIFFGPARFKFLGKIRFRYTLVSNFWAKK